MRKFKFKNQVILQLFTIAIFIPVICFIGCNGNSEQKSDTNAAATQPGTASTVIVADSRDSVIVPAQQDNQQHDGNKDPQKIIVPNEKKAALPGKIPAEQPVAVNTNPSENKPVSIPAPVINTPEPVKPKPETPIPVEVPKKPPVVVIEPKQNNWIVPAKYKVMTSPLAADKESIALGKNLYSTHCRSCHGSKGEGDGTKAASLDTKMRSFLDAGFQAQKPGEIYYKAIIGRAAMPRFEKKIQDEEERWALVQYIMSLKN